MSEKQARGEIRTAKVRKAAADLFLKRGYEGVTVDEIIAIAGGSKSSVYSEFGGKSGLFISTVESLLREANEPIGKIDYRGLKLQASLEKLAFNILKLLSTKRSVELHRLAISEAARMPQVGKSWYIYGPAKTTSYIRELLDRHQDELPARHKQRDKMAIAIHDALAGNTLDRLLAGLSKGETDQQLQATASFIVRLMLCLE